ncbi:transcription termination/antitermination protein NusG [Hydrotalea sp.]|uniref:transcription termination/antitermination protein NusG n=1 Tax=Hydrotalea sp. TaxID=2881279 RepID=UPI003D0BB709
MATEKKWYVLYTRAKWEKKVVALLNKKNITNYCPLNRVKKQWSDRKVVLHEPLFRSYVFVHITEKEKLTTRDTEGVLYFVTHEGKPAVIKEEEIVLIQSFLEQYNNVTVVSNRIHCNDTIRIIEGPLKKYEGKVLEVYKKSIKVILPSIGYSMIAEIDVHHVEKIDGNQINSLTA